MAPNGAAGAKPPHFPISDALKAEMGVGQGAAKIDVWYALAEPSSGH